MTLTKQDIADLIELAQLGCRTRRDREFVQRVALAIQEQWQQEELAANTNGNSPTPPGAVTAPPHTPQQAPTG